MNVMETLAWVGVVVGVLAVVSMVSGVVLAAVIIRRVLREM